MRTLKLYDAQDTEIASEVCKSNAARSSVRGAADQRQLDALIQRYPAAQRAELILPSNFRVNFTITAARRSSCEF